VRGSGNRSRSLSRAGPARTSWTSIIKPADGDSRAADGSGHRRRAPRVQIRHYQRVMRRLGAVIAAAIVVVIVVVIAGLSAASWALSVHQLDCPLTEFDQRSSEVIERRAFPPRSVCRYTYYAPLDESVVVESDDGLPAVVVFFASIAATAVLVARYVRGRRRVRGGMSVEPDSVPAD